MRTLTSRWAIVGLAALVTACTGEADGTTDNDPTAGEATELNVAAERLDARAPSPGAAEAAQLEQDVRTRIAEEAAARR